MRLRKVQVVLGLAVVSAVCATSASTSVAAAPDVPSVSRTSAIPGVSVVQIHDFVAPVIPLEEKTEAELMVEFRRTLPVRDLVVDIEQKFHDQVSFVAVGKTPYVGFSGSVPDEVFGMITGELPVPLIFVENTGYSETELLAQQA
ncbi:hypothetical protein JT358_05270 [Micrococcales bacterium 31B]|nr:hypothetical protein [Micrococcales bacterium 31B]